MSALEAVLEAIAVDVRIVGAGRAVLASGETLGFGTAGAPAAGLAETIYTRHYCRRGQPARPTVADRQTFVARLSAANPVAPREGVAREMITGGHYFAMGRPIVEAVTGRQVRFYWNVAPDGAPALLATLGAALERRRIPFQLKVPVAVDGYDRADGGVLYGAAEDVASLLDILRATHAALAGELREDTPLFVRRLAAGLGFAESPPGGESFGLQRSRLLAEGLIVAHANAQPPVDGMIARLTGYGLRVDQLERNPATCFPYDFAGFGA